MNDGQRMVAAALRHPWVGAADLDARCAALRVRPSAAAVAVRPVPGPLLREHLEHWTQVYDYVYAAGQGRHVDDLDLSGWRASDTGAPFPRAHMEAWVDHAVGLVLRDRPRTVLELGCGSGLLAHRLHPHVRSYVGADVSQEAVERLGRQRPGIRVVLAAAHEIAVPAVTRALTPAGATAPVPPDCVVLNSVTECFPNACYLTAVVNDALDLVAPGGTVLVGDVRNLATLGAFARWVEGELRPGLGPAELALRAAHRVAAEEELVCDPRLFARIAQRHPRPVRVAWHAKPMAADTELTRYRYDVTLTIDGGGPVDITGPPPARTVAWSAMSGPDRLAALGTPADPPTSVMVTGIPNALLDGDSAGARPAELHAARPPGAAVLLDEADGSRLAVGPPEHGSMLGCARGDGIPEELCNDPFSRFAVRRLAEVLADHLERELPGIASPTITVGDPVMP